MAARPKKSSGGTRNPERRNGKAWKKRQFDAKGRPVSGRGKPSGNSVKGMSARKVLDISESTAAMRQQFYPSSM